MDAGIADTVNRMTAAHVISRLDDVDESLAGKFGSRWTPWHRSPIADTLMGSNETSDADRAWLVGALAGGFARTAWDGHPADCDWENLFTHFRAEILARRDPQSHPACAAEVPVRDGVGSR